MAIFEGDKGARQSTLVNSTTAVAIFKLSNTSTSSSNTWSFATGTNNYTVINTGPNPLYVSTQSGVTTSTGFKLNKGDQLTVNGTAQAMYGVASGAAPATAIAGLATQSPVV